MKKGPIGVWFSVALIILGLGLWVGDKTGSRFAQYWESRQRQKQGTLSRPERAHVDSSLSELSAIQMLRLYVAAARNDKNLMKKTLLNEIGGLEILRRRSDAQEMGPVIDLYLGLAYVDAATAEEQDNNKVLATKYMNSAQPLFQSLGWRDYSEETLKLVARREIDRWNGLPQTRQKAK